MVGTYIKTIELRAAEPTVSSLVEIPADAPSGIYEVAISPLGNSSDVMLNLLDQGMHGQWDPTLYALHSSDMPVIVPDGNDSREATGYTYSKESDSVTLILPGGSSLMRLRVYAKHTQGTVSHALQLVSPAGEWEKDGLITTVSAYRIA